MQNLITKILDSFDNEKSFDLTKSELETLLRVSELVAQIEILENIPQNKEQFIEESDKELKELFGKQDFEELKNRLFL